MLTRELIRESKKEDIEFVNMISKRAAKGDKYFKYEDIIHEIIKIFANNKVSFKDSKLILKYAEEELEEQKISL